MTVHRRDDPLYSLFMQAPAAIAILRGAEHRFELVNPGYQALFPGRKLLGLPLREALPEIKNLEPLDKVYETGESYVDRESRVTLNGTEAFFNFVFQPMVVSDGKIEGVIVFGFEVTEQVNARRRAEETERDLRAKDEFLAVISHELRTPLTSILGWARMLRIGMLDEGTTQEALAALERSAQAQVHLIEDLLDDTRMTSGKLRLNKRALEIRSIVESALADLEPSAEAKGVKIVRDLQCDSCPMFADPIRLQQVVWNIVSNAIKFTPENGSVFVRVTREGSRAEIAVRDTGRGIDGGLLPQLFQRYRQGDGSSSRKSGVGLGLAISKYLVEQHDGTIQAASDGPGKGATFTIQFPITIEEPESFKQRESKRAEVLADLAGIRVLIVEDEADNRDVLSTVIERCGGEVRCAGNAADGLKSVETWNPDVLICDIALPDMDGCALLQEVRSRFGTPALALTVFGSAEEEARVRSCGFDVFRQKPIEPADLAHEIERLAHAAPHA